MYRLQRLCRNLPVRYYSAKSGKRETSDRDVSGRMLLLWSLRDGMSEKRRTPSAASGDEPCKIRLGKAGTRKLEGD